MTYFKIGEYNYSTCVNSLKVSYNQNYNAQTNAAGDTVVDYINTKRVIEVGIIPLDGQVIAPLLAMLDTCGVDITFMNPITNQLDSCFCIAPKKDVEYYTIRAGNTSLKAFTIRFTEL